MYESRRVFQQLVVVTVVQCPSASNTNTDVCSDTANLPDNEATDICCYPSGNKDECKEVCKNTECCFNVLTKQPY